MHQKAFVQKNEWSAQTLIVHFPKNTHSSKSKHISMKIDFHTRENRFSRKGNIF